MQSTMRIIHIKVAINLFQILLMLMRWPTGPCTISTVGGPRKTNATCGGACFAMHIENAPVTHSKISLDYTIYPPLIGDTACSENSLRVPLVYFGGFGCHLAFLAFKISSISSVVRFSPFTPTISSLRSFTLI